MRERPFIIPRISARSRITPARAGKTQVYSIEDDMAQDHPRSCGKDAVWVFRVVDASGSPPLVRERRLRRSSRLYNPRITPARAGKTGTVHPAYCRSADHPRSCGKDTKPNEFMTSSEGSPPLVRERPNCTPSEIARMGITPARAGKTKVILIEHLFVLDHPRSCGKDGKTKDSLSPPQGSPPLVRERRYPSTTFDMN